MLTRSRCSTGWEQAVRTLDRHGPLPRTGVFRSWKAAFHTQYLWIFPSHVRVCILITQNEDAKHYIFSVGQEVLCSSMFTNPALTTVGYRCPQIAFTHQGWLNEHPPLAWLGLPPGQQSCCSSTTIFSPEFIPCLSILFVFFIDTYQFPVLTTYTLKSNSSILFTRIIQMQFFLSIGIISL